MVRDGREFYGAWTAQTVAGILRNSSYTGTMTWGLHARTGERLRCGKKRMERSNAEDQIAIENARPRIVDPDLFARIQVKLAENAAKFDRDHMTRTRYLLSGFLDCGECKRRLSIGLHVAGEPHYRCDFAHKTGKCSNRTRVSAPKLERKVLQVLEASKKDPSRLAALVEEHNRSIAAVNQREGARVQALRAKRRDVAGALDSLAKAVEMADDIPALVGLMKTRQAELDALDRQIADGQAELKPLLVPRRTEEFVEGDAQLIDDEVAARRRVTEDVRKIVVYPDGAIVLHFAPESLFELTTYGFDLDEDTETADLRGLRQRHMVAATRVEGGREPFAIEEGGSILYGATVKMPPGFRLSGDDLLDTPSGAKRSQRPQRDSKAKFRDAALEIAADRRSGVRASPSGRSASPRSHVVQPDRPATMHEHLRRLRFVGCALA